MSAFYEEHRGKDRLIVNVEPDSEGYQFRAYCGGEIYTSAFMSPYGDKRQLDPPSVPWTPQWLSNEDANESALKIVGDSRSQGST